MIDDNYIPEINVDRLMQRILEASPSANSSPALVSPRRPSNEDKILNLDDVAAELVRIASVSDSQAPMHLSLSELSCQLGPRPFQKSAESSFHLRDFVAYDDVEFVQTAYQSILKREPDQEGLRCYLAMLRDGAPKAEILNRICQSPEGRERGVKIDGLRLRCFIDSISRWPFVGRLVAISVALWTLPDTQRNERRLLQGLARRLQQSEQHFARNAAGVTDALNRLERSHNQLSDLTRHSASKVHSEALQSALMSTIRSMQSLLTSTATNVKKESFERQINGVWAVQAETHKTIEVLTRKIGALQESKADAVALQNFDALVLSAIESKAERDEITALASLFDNHVTKNEIALVWSSIQTTNDLIEHLRTHKTDYSDLDAIGAQIKHEFQEAVEEVRSTVHGFADSKADQAAIGALRLELSAAFEETIVAAKATLLRSMNGLDQKFGFLEQSKADRRTLETLRLELNDALQQVKSNWSNRFDQLLAEKADIAAVEALKADTHFVNTVSRKSGADALQAGLAGVNLQVHELKKMVLDQDRRVGLLLEEARKRFPKAISSAQLEAMIDEDDHRLDAMYATFEDVFRGTRVEIRRRQSIYLPYVREAMAGTAHSPVIDIGCGRGEWLELLHDEGLVAIGVDLNRIFIDACRELGLNVFEEDAIVHLRRLKRDSVGVVTAFHMIEHLDHKIMIALLDETLRVLRPGGIAIFESPNPKNVVVGSCNFYFDPTHRRPLPPDLSRYLLEARGFSNVEVLELHPCGAEQMISEGPQELRDALNQMLYSAQDYAVIGRKV